MLQCFVARTKKAFNIGLYIVVGCCISLMLLNVFQTNVQIYSNIMAYVKALKAFFVRATKHWSIVGLVRQS